MRGHGGAMRNLVNVLSGSCPSADGPIAEVAKTGTPLSLHNDEARRAETHFAVNVGTRDRA